MNIDLYFNGSLVSVTQEEMMLHVRVKNKVDKLCSARYCYSNSVRPSVCLRVRLSVTHWN